MQYVDFFYSNSTCINIGLRVCRKQSEKICYTLNFPAVDFPCSQDKQRRNCKKFYVVQPVFLLINISSKVLSFWFLGQLLSRLHSIKMCISSHFLDWVLQSWISSILQSNRSTVFDFVNFTLFFKKQVLIKFGSRKGYIPRKL